MKPNFTPNTQNIIPHYTSPTHKHNSPNTQSRLSHNAQYTNSNKDISIKNQQTKDQRYLCTFSPNYTSTNKKFNQSSPNKPDISNISTKPPSPYIQNKNAPLKGSMYIGQTKFQHSKYTNLNGGNNDKNGAQKIKRAPRMSQVNFNEMRASNTQIQNQLGKIPSFLNQKRKNQQESNFKKIPYPNEFNERPQSSKQIVNKFQLQKEYLSKSYGMKQSKLDIDPTSEWVKKSWSKKKQKKFTINDFYQIKQLGSGKYGKVFLVKQKKTNFICALKIIQKKVLKEEDITQQFIRQLKIQTFINHPNIIKMYGFFDDLVNIYIILEVGTGGQLFKQLKKHVCMPQSKVATIMRQICKAVDQLHCNKVIHRDIKPQNIVLHDNIIKLCDFGWSVHRDQSMRKTFCGTPLYVCPQILKGKGYDQKIDIWSLGVMMYEMLIGQNPFKITKQEQLIKIVKDQINIPSYVTLSEEGKNFLDSCLQKNPEKRLNIRQLLNHSFFKKYPQKNRQVN